MNRDQLETVYRATTYLAHNPAADIPIRLGRFHPKLDALLKSEPAVTWAFITACNPRSEPLTDSANAARMQALKAEVEKAGYIAWEGEGIPDSQTWSPEPSLLIIGITQQEALNLADRYDQNAFVFGEIGASANLIWTYSPSNKDHLKAPFSCLREKGVGG